MNDNGTFILEGLPNVGVWKSTNGGATWRQTMPGRPAPTSPTPSRPSTRSTAGSVLAIGGSAAGRNTLYAGGGFQLWKTADAGTTWSAVFYSPDPNGPMSSGHPGYYKERGDLNNVWTNFVVTDPNQPQRIYYGDADNSLQVSHNGGASFELIGGPIDNPIIPLTGDRDWNAVTVDASGGTESAPTPRPR